MATLRCAARPGKWRHCGANRSPYGEAMRAACCSCSSALRCTRSNRPIELKPAFSDDTVVGELRPSWSVTSDERGNGNGLERRVAVRVDAVNQLSDRLYVRLTKLRLIGPNGPLRDRRSVECTLAPGDTKGLLEGSALDTGCGHRDSARPPGGSVHRAAQRARPRVLSRVPSLQRPQDTVAIDRGDRDIRHWHRPARPLSNWRAPRPSRNLQLGDDRQSTDQQLNKFFQAGDQLQLVLRRLADLGAAVIACRGARAARARRRAGRRVPRRG